MKNSSSSVKSIAHILQNFNPVVDKFVSREYQSFGIYLCEKLKDYKRRGLYIKLSKTIPRPILEKALSFVSDAQYANNKGALFMWKLTELGVLKKKQKKLT